MKNPGSQMHSVEPLPVDSKFPDMLGLNTTSMRPQQPQFMFNAHKSKDRGYPQAKNGILHSQNYSTLNNLGYSTGAATANTYSTGAATANTSKYNIPPQHASTLALKITKKKSSAKPKKRKRR